MMTPEQFVVRAMGIPWVRWRSDWEAVDCFGLLILYHREVFGLELGQVPQLQIAEGFARAADWIEAAEGATSWMAFRGEAAVHCGILLPWGEALHSEGSAEHPGSVRRSSLRSIRRVYGTVKTFRHAGHR